jgi:flagellar biosynthesis protein FlhB
MPDRSTQTEEPTQRRLEKARQEGQFAQAKEFVSALQFLAVLGLLSTGGAAWTAGLRQTTRALFQRAFAGDLGVADLTALTWSICRSLLLPLAAAGMAITVLTLSFRLATTKFGFSWKKLAPDVKRFNPISKLRDLPKQNLPQVGQAVLLLPLFLWAVYVVARDKVETILTLPLASVDAGYRFLAAALMELFWKAGALFLVFGAVDLFRQLKRHKQDLRMSKQEIREEMKELEGNPQMKAKIRRIQRDRARRQMMKEVPTATAVVVNPTHYAVALKYEVDSMAAPRVVAKGKNYLALRIRQKAIDHQVPLIENPPLAQALYKSVDVGQEIPPHLYRAVAEILAYIFKLMHGRMPG